MQGVVRVNTTIIWPTIRRYIATNSTMATNAIKKPIATAASTNTTTTTTTTTAAKTVGKPAATTSNNTVKGYTRPLAQSLNATSKMGTKTLETRQEAPSALLSNNTVPEIDWYNSWHGLGSRAFDAQVQETLLQELDASDIEIKPDGLIYLPEIKYRRILNKAFGAGGWGLVPRSETIVTANLVTREYGLICHGQLVGVARGEQDYFNETGIPTATEGCKSNALMRCCKDLGIGSELWDPVFIKSFKEKYCQDKFVEHVTTKKKKKIWLRKDRKVEYPYK